MPQSAPCSCSCQERTKSKNKREGHEGMKA
jgi:hypothetical protein